MRIILTSPKGKKFMVKPCSTGLDYETFVENPNYGKPKKKGKNAGEINTEEWKSLGSYSSTIWYAIKIVVEKMMKDPEEEVVIKASWGPLIKQISGIKDCITAYVDRITMEVENGN